MSNSPKDDELGFKVIDRRLFDQEGHVRPDSETLRSESGAAVDLIGSTSELNRKSNVTPGSKVTSLESNSKREHEAANSVQSKIKQSAAPSQKEQPRKDHGYAGGEMDFSSFVISLATQAVVLMGEIPHPETGERIENFEAARQTVDILGMLEAKTKGNLTAEETHLIEEALTSLRMAYVAKVKKS